jgi:hypothetical protein
MYEFCSPALVQVLRDEAGHMQNVHCGSPRGKTMFDDSLPTCIRLSSGPIRDTDPAAVCAVLGVGHHKISHYTSWYYTA